MHFYPDGFRFAGVDTRLPNLLLMIDMARSWTARGDAAADPVAGLDDCRRAIRLGRLLRQDDAVLINDLVGLACIHIGTRGVYAIAQRTGDTRLALLASIVIGEVAPQRLYTSQRMTTLDLSPFLHKDAAGDFALTLPDDRFDEVIAMAKHTLERRFFGEALLWLGAVERLGTPAQQAQATAVLDDAEASGDPLLAAMVRTSRAGEAKGAMWEQMIERFKK